MAHPRDGRRKPVTAEEAETAFEDAGTFEAMAAVAANAINALAALEKSEQQWLAWERYVEARHEHVLGREEAMASPHYADHFSGSES